MQHSVPYHIGQHRTVPIRFRVERDLLKATVRSFAWCENPVAPSLGYSKAHRAPCTTSSIINSMLVSMIVHKNGGNQPRPDTARGGTGAGGGPTRVGGRWTGVLSFLFFGHTHLFSHHGKALRVPVVNLSSIVVNHTHVLRALNCLHNPGCRRVACAAFVAVGSVCCRRVPRSNPCLKRRKQGLELAVPSACDDVIRRAARQHK